MTAPKGSNPPKSAGLFVGFAADSLTSSALLFRLRFLRTVRLTTVRLYRGTKSALVSSTLGYQTTRDAGDSAAGRAGPALFALKLALPVQETPRLPAAIRTASWLRAITTYAAIGRSRLTYAHAHLRAMTLLLPLHERRAELSAPIQSATESASMHIEAVEMIGERIVCIRKRRPRTAAAATTDVPSRSPILPALLLRQPARWTAIAVASGEVELSTDRGIDGREGGMYGDEPLSPRDIRARAPNI